MRTADGCCSVCMLEVGGVRGGGEREERESKRAERERKENEKRRERERAGGRHRKRKQRKQKARNGKKRQTVGELFAVESARVVGVEDRVERLDLLGQVIHGAGGHESTLCQHRASHSARIGSQPNQIRYTERYVRTGQRTARRACRHT
eukprot:3101186-Rhodomonas_salina.1